jgi:hypothetical protein
MCSKRYEFFSSTHASMYLAVWQFTHKHKKQKGAAQRNKTFLGAAHFYRACYVIFNLRVSSKSSYFEAFICA